MRVEYINPFVTAAFTVLETCLGQAPSKGKLSMLPSVFTSQQCNIITGVTGMIEGQVIYGMSLKTADLVASRMIGESIRSFDQLAASAIAELGNMITGNAMSNLSNAGYICDITPPTMIRGTKIKLSTLSIPAIVIPISTEQGEIELTVSLRERK